MLFATVGQRAESVTVRDGAAGWDEYAPFYDWENAQTVARRDVPFWCRLAAAQPPSGARARVRHRPDRRCRSSAPARRSSASIARADARRARRRLRRARLTDRALLVRGDIRALPFRRRAGFGCVMAPYGMLQSLTRERDLRRRWRRSPRAAAGGLFAIDLVPDLPRWAEYARRTSLRGPHARGTLTLSSRCARSRRAA